MNLLDISLQYRVIIGISAMVLLFSSFLIAFISNQRKKLQYHKDLQVLHEEQQQLLTRQNALLEQRVQERTGELQQQKEALQNALTDLKATQIQLIQKEKMASLGELTAGIAHEIQNPLNFVNNFSELNTELLLELKEMLGHEELPQNERKNINDTIQDIIQNLQKINHHGKRADDIVKSMLQHSRANRGENDFTGINALADECVRLSYNGYQAKDKSFNATIKTEFDKSLDDKNIISEDMGRVIINLCDNAFYSIKEKKKRPDLLKGGLVYEPTLFVSTINKGDRAELKIRDNGIGISPKVIDKIYNPFFTTKPSGQGTGLGLSLSYDIIKAHRGELKVESTEGEFAEFTIELRY